MIQITASACFFLALVFLLVPLRWAASLLMAALFHELCHYLTIMLAGGKVTAVTIRANGAVMEACIPSTGKELLCAAAGPTGSFLLLLLCRKVPEMAVSGLIQGSINLLPAYPLDGGRILKCLLELAGMENTQRVLLQVKRITYLLIVLFAAMFSRRFSAEKLFLIFGFLWLMKWILRNRPCKQEQNGVQ